MKCKVQINKKPLPVKINNYKNNIYYYYNVVNKFYKLSYNIYYILNSVIQNVSTTLHITDLQTYKI